MKSITYPIGLPEDLYSDIRRTASQTQLSMAEAIRQSIKLGLPTLRQRLSPSRSKLGQRLKPFSKTESRLAFQTPNPEFDALEHHCASLPKRLPEE